MRGSVRNNNYKGGNRWQMWLSRGSHASILRFRRSPPRMRVGSPPLTLVLTPPPTSQPTPATLPLSPPPLYRRVYAKKQQRFNHTTECESRGKRPGPWKEERKGPGAGGRLLSSHPPPTTFSLSLSVCPTTYHTSTSFIAPGSGPVVDGGSRPCWCTLRAWHTGPCFSGGGSPSPQSVGCVRGSR